MGGALARAAAKNAGNRVLLFNRTQSKAEALAKQIGAVALDVETLVRESDFVFLGVKPQMLQGLAETLTPLIQAREDRFVLVTMAAGVTTAQLTAWAGEIPVIRIMPNTPASIGQGMILYSPGPGVTAGEEEAFLRAMGAAGRFLKLEERLIDAGSSVSGCGPAFADLFIEALADGGVACGLPRKQAQEMAAQMLLGSAALCLESGKHPGVLKDAVCSPGGTTIQGVRVLEERGFRAAVMDAVIAAYEKNFNLK